MLGNPRQQIGDIHQRFFELLRRRRIADAAFGARVAKSGRIGFQPRQTRKCRHKRIIRRELTHHRIELVLLRTRVVQGFRLGQRQHDHLDRLFRLVDGVPVAVTKQTPRRSERFIGEP